jgi:hypothetical protein
MADLDQGKFVTRLFTDRDTAEREWTSLRNRGYGERDINVVMSEEGRKRHFADGHRTELGDRAAKGGATGAGIGAVAGGTLDAIAATASVAIPGAGLLIAGPLAAALAGAGAGAVTGGVLGALVNMGIPKDHAREYESGLKKGGILFGLEPRSEDRDYFDREWTPESVDVRRGTGQNP